MLTLGIDPGLRGALAMLDGHGAIELLADLPTIADRSLAWIDGGAMQTMLLQAMHGRPCRAIVERVSSMPKQGIASAFTFGAVVGSILGVLQTLQISIELVTAAAWKRSLGLSSDKRAALDKARLLFPRAELHLAKHDGRAEALLIAHYASRKTHPPTQGD